MAVFLGCTSIGHVGLCFLWFLCPGTLEGSTGRGSGFKASQKTGQRLKVSPDRLGEAGNRTCGLFDFFVLKLKCCMQTKYRYDREILTVNLKKGVKGKLPKFWKKEIMAIPICFIAFIMFIISTSCACWGFVFSQCFL